MLLKVFLFFLLVVRLSFSINGQEVKLGFPPTLSNGNLAFFEKSGKYFLTTTENLITVWDLNLFVPLVEIKFNGKLTHWPEFSNESSNFVIAYETKGNQSEELNYGISVFNLLGEEVFKFDRQKARIDKVAYDNSGTKLYSFSRDGKINCWDAENGDFIKMIEFEQSENNNDVRIYSPPIFNKAGNEVLLNYKFSNNASISKLINLNTGKTIFSRNNSLSSVFYENESKIITSSSSDSALYVWNYKTGELTQTIKTGKKLVYLLSYSNGERLIAMDDANEFKVPVYDIKKGILINELKSEIGYFIFLFLNKNEEEILVSGNKSTNVFNASDGILKYNLPFSQAYFNPDGTKIICTKRNKIAIFNAETGQELKSILTQDAYWSINTPIFKNSEVKLNSAGLKALNIDSLIFNMETGEGRKNLNDIPQLLFEERKGNVQILMDNSSIEGQYLDSIIGNKNKQKDLPILFEKYKVFINYGTPWDSTIIRVQKDNEPEIRFGVQEEIDQFVLNKLGNKILIHSDDIVSVWDLSTGQEITHYLNSDISYLDKEGNYLLINSISGDFSYLYDFKSDRKRKLEGHGQFSTDKSVVITCSKNNIIRLYDINTGSIIISSHFIQSDMNKWIHFLPSGLFDASPEAMELMYWTKGLEVIEFAQLKSRYWVPDLWEKVVKGERLPDARNMNDLKLQPDVELGEVKDGKIPVTLTKRDGGYGKVSILINGKEIEADARGNNFDKTKETQTIWVDLKDHPNLLNGENTIAVKASSEDGFVTGRPEEKKLTMSLSKPKPHFYAVVVGTGKYMNSSINLKFPEKDASSISTSLQLGSEQLFGKENTHIYTLTTADAERPTKEKIKSVFSEISKTATSSDVILVYLSGHGISWGGEQNDFYYVTTEATAANSEAFNDEVIRKNTTISTAEFTEYLNAIPALKQVMIIDACASGKAVDNLMAAKDIDVSQIKAIDRMKDRTGMFVISGSAADAVSYEASRYGQGLLTYSILQAMKGAALRDGQFFDVNMILNYARESVPKLAAGIGGIQTPQLLAPKGGSFDIGQVNEESKKKIPLSTIKPVFVRSTMFDLDQNEDAINLGKAIDEKLNQISMRGSNGQLIFMDIREYPDAYRLSGGYTQKNGVISLKLKIKGPKESEHQLSGASKEILLEQLIEIAEGLE